MVKSIFASSSNFLTVLIGITLHSFPETRVTLFRTLLHIALQTLALITPYRYTHNDRDDYD